MFFFLGLHFTNRLALDSLCDYGEDIVRSEWIAGGPRDEELDGDLSLENS